MTDAEISEYVRRLVDAAPPLTPDQRVRLAALLRPDLPISRLREMGTKGVGTADNRCYRNNGLR